MIEKIVSAIEKLLDAFLSRANSIIPLFLAASSTAGLFSAIGMLMEHNVPPESREALMVLVGSLATAWLAVMNYFFGSSAGSQAKTTILAGTLAKNGNVSKD